MTRTLLFSLAILLWARSLGENFLPYMIIWNVGQGQWVTYVSIKTCEHFDVGGESYPALVEKICRNRQNFYSISHWDFDHYRYLRRFKRRIAAQKSQLAPLFNPSKKTLSKNDQSMVYWHKGFLFPGDSTKKMEKLWAEKIPRATNYLLVPHHGSQTSSSNYLLDHCSEVKMAFVSARKQKYGHPHPKIEARYKEFRIPLLRTEVWGHIFVYLKEN